MQMSGLVALFYFFGVFFSLQVRVASSLTIKLNPHECRSGDCHALISDAFGRCKEQHQINNESHPCFVFLDPGTYIIKCPRSTRPSSAQIEAPAVEIAELKNIVFGGQYADKKPEILIDYQNGGCAAIVAENSSRISIQNLVIDALRLPYTVNS